MSANTGAGNKETPEIIKYLDFDKNDFLRELKSESVTQTIKNYLQKYNIDLRHEEYWNEKMYKDCLVKHIHHKHSFFNVLTFDYYIREIMLTPNEKSQIVDLLSSFDMGNCKKPPNNLAPKDLIDDIQYTLEYPMHPELDGEDLSRKIRKKLFEKSSVLERFEDISQISLSTCDDQYSVYKLLKLLYKFSKTDYYGQMFNKNKRGKINLFSIFGNPSFDNLDLTLLDELPDNNGKYIALFKNELLKEVPLNTAVIYPMILREMIFNWDRFILSTQDFLFSDNDTALRCLDIRLQPIIKNFMPYENCEKNSATLFATVYFWTIQNECRCVREEFIKINSYIIRNFRDYSYIYTNRHNEDSYIPLQQLKNYIQTYKEDLAYLITANNFSHDKAVTLAENSHKQISIFYNWLLERTFRKNTEGGTIPSSFILASLLAMRDALATGEKAEHSYYLAPRPGKNMDLFSKINNRADEDTYYKNLWLKKISCIQMCILHPKSTKYKLSIENSIYSIMLQLFSISDIKKFDEANKYYLSLVTEVFSDVPMNQQHTP